MPVVVVATMTAKPESVDTVRDACKRPSKRCTANRAASSTALHEAERHVRVRRAVGRRRRAEDPQHRTGDRRAVRRDRRAPRRRPRHQDAGAGRRGRSGQGPAARLTWERSTGKVAFITGAARGQGRAHAVKLASEGADIIAVDLCDQIDSVPYPMATPDDLAATVKLVEETGARIVALEADVRDRDSLKTALRAGTEELGDRLDIVIANAGIAPMAGEDAWQDVIDVNLTGVYHTVDVAMRPMIKFGNGGAIVLTSSVAGPGRAWRRRWPGRSAMPRPSTASSGSCGCTRISWRSTTFGSTRYTRPA